MTYAIQRTYGKTGRDYLHAWDEKYGTACIGAISQAMTFGTKEEADAAAARAQAECKGADGVPATGISFAAVEVPAIPLTATQVMESQEAGRAAAIMGNADSESPYSNAELAECYRRGVAEGLQQIADQAAQRELTRRVMRERR